MGLLILAITLVVSAIFYLLDKFGVEEFGGLSHIALAGLLIFIPFFNRDYYRGCILDAIKYSLLAFLPIILLKFDIITFIISTFYGLFLSNFICDKLKRRSLETED